MPTLGILLAVLTLLVQSVPVQSQQLSTSEEAVSRIIDSGLFDGHDNKVIGGIGDAAAVTITKVVGGKSLSADQIERILIVLNMAFGDVKPGPDAEPKTTLFVLRELELYSSGAQLKDKIEKTRIYVEEEYSRSKPLLPK